MTIRDPHNRPFRIPQPRRTEDRYGDFFTDGELVDRSIKVTLARILRDGVITDTDLLDLIKATFDEDGVTPLERSNLRRILLQSVTLRHGAKSLLAKFLDETADDESVSRAISRMPRPKARSGWAFGGCNFAGKGYRYSFRARPTNIFDLAAKIHDLGYSLNDVEFKVLDYKDPLTQSRKAKVDYLFRVINVHGTRGKWPNTFLGGLASDAFDGWSQREFVANDGFVNPLTNLTILAQLCDPAKYLMIPYDQLPANQQKRSTIPRPLVGRPEEAGLREQVVTESDWTTAVAYDRTPGFWKWFLSRFGAVRSAWGITSKTGYSADEVREFKKRLRARFQCIRGIGCSGRPTFTLQ